MPGRLSISQSSTQNINNHPWCTSTANRVPCHSGMRDRDLFLIQLHEWFACYSTCLTPSTPYYYGVYCTTSIGRWDTARHSDVGLSCFLGKMDASCHFRLIRQDLMASAGCKFARDKTSPTVLLGIFYIRCAHVEVEKAVMRMEVHERR